jgi:hypothetical protein
MVFYISPVPFFSSLLGRTNTPQRINKKKRKCDKPTSDERKKKKIHDLTSIVLAVLSFKPVRKDLSVSNRDIYQYSFIHNNMIYF